MDRQKRTLETRPDGSRVSLEQDGPDSLLVLAAALPPGTLLRDGRLRIEKRIGRGAMGEVYIAFDLERGERVALKLLLDPSGEAIYRIKREFRSVAELVHDNLVRLHELFEDGGRWFFTMELVSGRHLIAQDQSEQPTVARASSAPPVAGVEAPLPAPPRLPMGLSAAGFLVNDCQPIDVGEVRRRFAQLARGIIEIHDSGQLHRDLKPSNVLVTETGRVVILDFGLAMSLAEQQQVRETLGLSGTPAYMAPETIAGDPPTEACDWYAFGVMLYEALAGRLPFEGSVTSVLTSKQRWSALPPSQVRGEELEPELEKLCVALLHRDPTERATRVEIEQVLCTAEAERVSLPVDPRFLSLRPGFFGRDAELLEIERSLAILGEAAEVVFIPGESGIGKTALLDEACARLSGLEDVWVLRSRCYEREEVPFKAFDGALDTLCNSLRESPDEVVANLLPGDIELLAQLFPVLRRIGLVDHLVEAAGDEVEPGELRSRAFQCLAELLRRLSRSGKVVLALDDLQWMDVDSVRLLMALLSAKEPVPLLLLGTYRSEETGPTLSALLSGVRDVGARSKTCPLAALPAAITRKLIARVAERAPASELAAMADESEGSPYLAIQLAFFHREGQLRTGSGVDQLLAEQVELLPAAARRLLWSICLSPSPTRRSVLSAAAGLDHGPPGMLAMLRQARLLRVLDAGGDPRICAYHERVRGSVLRHLPAEEAAVLHSALADEWQRQTTADPEVILCHLLACGRSAEAGRFARLAGDAALRRHAYDLAATRFELALLLSPSVESDAERLELMVSRAQALAASGAGPAAAAVFLKAADLCDGERRTELRSQAAKQLLESYADTTDLLLEVLRERRLAPRGALGRSLLLRAALRTPAFKKTPAAYVRPAIERGDLLSERFDVYLSAGLGLMLGQDLKLCAYFFAEAVRLGRDCGEPGRVAIALALDAWRSVFVAEVPANGIVCAEVVGRIDEARQLLLACHQPAVIAHGHLLFGQALSAAGALQLALVEFDLAETGFSSLAEGGGQLAACAAVSALHMRILTGDWEKARRAAASAVEAGETRGQPHLRQAGHFALAVLALASADVAASREHLGAVFAGPEHQRDTWVGVAARQVQVQLDMMSGEPGAHRAELERTIVRQRSTLHRRHHRPWTLAALGAVSLVEAGQPSSSRAQLLRQATALGRELSESKGVRALRPFGVALLAGVALLRRDPDGAVRLLLRAEGEFADLGMLPWFWMVRLQRGQVLGGQAGETLSAEAALELRRSGVLEPGALAGVYLPGLGDRSS